MNKFLSSYSKSRFLFTPLFVLSGIIFLLFLSSCGEKKFKISGSVEDAPEESFIALEMSDANGRWMTLDSVKINSSGEFSFSRPAVSAPEIIRLRFRDDYIYLPVDSIEHLTVKASAKNFSYGFTVEGSENAHNMAIFDKRLADAAPSFSNPDSLNAFKRRIYSDYLKDAEGSVFSYYVLTKIIDGKPLYDSLEDYPYFAAVATAFRQYRPEDPRPTLLEAVSLEGLRRRNATLGKANVYQAPETAIIDITLPTTDGTDISLSDIVGKGKKTILYFSGAHSEDTARLNIALRSLREKYGIEIFHVSFDPDSHAWRTSSLNLPWVSVWGGNPTAAERILADYNITALPVFFIYDAQGQLTNRAATLQDLTSLL